METIRLEFYSDELKIVQEDEEFLKNKAMIQSRINKSDDGTVEYFTFTEMDILLEEIISKYED
ncbi:MAG: hypothetical protein I4O51_04855 [Flavobacterium micromati]|nr:hypothetical protein [Flavobacterium micromati]